MGARLTCEVPLPLPRARGPERWEVSLRQVASLPPQPELLRHEEPDFPGGPVLRLYTDAREHGARLEYAGWRFVFERGRPEITYTQTGPARVALEQIVERALLPLYLLSTRHGLVALHGGAIASDGRAWACVGISGAGKSTAALELVRRGARLICDDMAMVEAAEGIALPGAVTLRLWRDQLQEAVEDAPIGGAPQKRWFRLGDERGAPAPTSLAGILVLSPDDGAPATGALEGLRGVEALTALLAQTFDIRWPGQAWARRRVRHTRRLVEGVPIWRYRYARDPQGRPLHVEGIARHIGLESGGDR